MKNSLCLSRELPFITPILVCLMLSHFDGPLLTTSAYWPLLFCSQVCLVCEVISLWLGEWFVALSFRLMIGLVLCCVLYFRAYSKEKYAAELPPLLRVIPLQDALTMLLTQGLYVLYTWILIYLPVLGLLLYHHHQRLEDYVRVAKERLLHYYVRVVDSPV